MTPTFLELLILSLAAYRLFRLIAWDSILDGVRNKAYGATWTGSNGDSRVIKRARLEKFLTCPWCAGFYVSLGFFLAWTAWPDDVFWVATPLALSTAVALIEKLD